MRVDRVGGLAGGASVSESLLYGLWAAPTCTPAATIPNTIYNGFRPNCRRRRRFYLTNDLTDLFSAERRHQREAAVKGNSHPDHLGCHFDSADTVLNRHLFN